MSDRSPPDGPRPRAVILAVQLPGVSDEEHDASLAELGRLGKTLGIDVVGRVSQKRRSLAAGKVVGDGKLVELAGWTGGTGLVPGYEKPGRGKDDDGDDEAAAVAAAALAAEMAAADDDDGADADADAAAADAGSGGADEGGAEQDGPRATVILVDHDLTPTQQRNLERATSAEVHDRSSVILGIFHRHAHTREARLQVEIARLSYLAPRLRESGGGGDRVRGGVGGRGAGESSLELDRRRIRDRIAELRRELAAIEGSSKVRRGRRSDLPSVALVGYTNAGKSSLMRALTGSDSYVADKLFATLDTTVRVLVPRTDPPILVSDTVGFIKKLPHDLVASFRSTLDEAGDADLLLHVVDASDPAFRDHMRLTREVLAELDADRPEWLVLNKRDRLEPAAAAALAEELPDAILLSAHTPGDVAALHDRIVARFLGELEDAELRVPWSHQRLVHDIHEHCQVAGEEHDADGTLFRVRAPRSVLDRLGAALAAPPVRPGAR